VRFRFEEDQEAPPLALRKTPSKVGIRRAPEVATTGWIQMLELGNPAFASDHERPPFVLR
jgi:hypothetical protein